MAPSERRPDRIAFHRTPHLAFGLLTWLIVGLSIPIWFAAIGEICDWGRFTNWWQVDEFAELFTNRRTIRGLSTQARETEGVNLRSGDQILLLFGQPVTNRSWRRAFRRSSPGDKWDLVISRAGSTQTSSITLQQSRLRWLWLVAILLKPFLALTITVWYRIARGPNLDALSLAGFMFLFGFGPLNHSPGIFAEFDGLARAIPETLNIFALVDPLFVCYACWRWPKPLEFGERSSRWLFATLAAMWFILLLIVRFAGDWLGPVALTAETVSHYAYETIAVFFCLRWSATEWRRIGG